MKTLMFLVFSVLMLPQMLTGQYTWREYQNRKNYNNLITSIPKKDDIRFNYHTGNFKNAQFFTEEDNNHVIVNYPSALPQDSVITGHHPDFDIAEEYPGSSRHYGNPFIIKPDRRGKLIIKKPDSRDKFYLIIKDPIRHTITK